MKMMKMLKIRTCFNIKQAKKTQQEEERMKGESKGKYNILIVLKKDKH